MTVNHDVVGSSPTGGASKHFISAFYFIKIVFKKRDVEPHPESLTFEVFCYVLTYENKVQIYELRKQGYSYKQLSNR